MSSTICISVKDYLIDILSLLSTDFRPKIYSSYLIWALRLNPNINRRVVTNNRYVKMFSSVCCFKGLIINILNYSERRIAPAFYWLLIDKISGKIVFPV